jgi:hypothetical protein
MVDPARTNQKVVFILVHPEDVDEYQKIGKSVEGFHVLIAATPDACWELEKRGIAFRGIENYIDPSEIYSRGMSNYASLDRLCNDIDDLLKDNNPLLKKYRLNPALDNFYYFKILFDNITFRISFIQLIIRREKPDILATFQSIRPERTKWNPHDPPFDSSDNIYSIVMSLNGWKCNIKILHRVTFNEEVYDPLPPQSRIQRIKKSITKYPALFIPLFSLKNFSFIKAVKMILYQYRNYFRISPSLFLLRQEPSWSSIIYQVYKQGYQVVYLPSQIDQVNTEGILDPNTRKTITDRIHTFASYMEIDYSDIFSDHIILTISTYIAYVPQIIDKIEDMIDSYHPAAFLCSEKASIVEHIYAHIGQFHHIPVLAWQHGEGPFYPPMQVYVELMNSDVHLSYGRGHQQMLSTAPHNHFNCKIESIGSFTLEKLRVDNRNTGHKQKILYVTSPFYYNYMYFSAYPVIDNERWSDQKQILMAVGHLPFETVFKLSAGQKRHRFMDEYIAKNHLDNITVVWNERTFMELLNEVDIVICDAPETPVIEAIAAGKTVFVLLSSQFLREEALVLLKKRVFWSTDINAFVKLISDYLSGVPVDQHPDIKNTEYLEMFGVHKLDGKVAERALDILNRETHSFG